MENHTVRKNIRSGILIGLGIVAAAAIAVHAWPDGRTPAERDAAALEAVRRVCDARLRADRPEVAAGAWQVVSVTGERIRARAYVQPRDAGPKNRVVGSAECIIPVGGAAVVTVGPAR